MKHTFFDRPLFIVLAVLLAALTSTNAIAGRSGGGGSSWHSSNSSGRSSYGSSSRSGGYGSGRSGSGSYRSYDGLPRAKNGGFYHVVNGKYSSAKITGRVSSAVPLQYMRVATVGGRTYKWDSRSGFSQRIFARDGRSYLGDSSAPGPRLTTPYVPLSVYHSTWYPGYGWGGGWYYGNWYGPTFLDVWLWSTLLSSSSGTNVYYINGPTPATPQPIPYATETPDPDVIAPQPSTPCTYYDANGHEVDVQVVGSSCPESTDSSTPPPDAQNDDSNN